MEVKVDSNLIRSKRENRGWSQGHLATVAGLSLRTIQRIEKTGSASLESATALASVFSVELAVVSGVLLRASALIGASALSYLCAVMTFLNADTWFSIGSTFTSFLLASFVGVAIVLVGAKILIPLRVTAAFWFLGLAASLVGGVAMYVGLETFGDSTSSTVVSFCAWHILACIAIYRGRQSHDAEDGLLAAFARTRGRFSIVPGWMKLSHSTLG